MEQTLILIKPDAIQKRLTGIILARLETLGLDIVAAKATVTNRALWEEHYANLKGTPFVQSVIDFMMGNFN
ncbi:MAG: nucleoside-diphosphate kinase, partial [Elusimicrobiaceae bacterium]|nr:nucleoside-diphosphate kinase [Elusimicrobiaceae bacterium]